MVVMFLVSDLNHDNYKEAIQALRELGAYEGRNTYIEQNEINKNELPFDEQFTPFLWKLNHAF